MHDCCNASSGGASTSQLDGKSTTWHPSASVSKHEWPSKPSVVYGITLGITQLGNGPQRQRLPLRDRVRHSISTGDSNSKVARLPMHTILRQPCLQLVASTGAAHVPLHLRRNFAGLPQESGGNIVAPGAVTQLAGIEPVSALFDRSKSYVLVTNANQSAGMLPIRALLDMFTEVKCIAGASEFVSVPQSLGREPVTWNVRAQP